MFPFKIAEVPLPMLTAKVIDGFLTHAGDVCWIIKPHIPTWPPSVQWENHGSPTTLIGSSITNIHQKSPIQSTIN